MPAHDTLTYNPPVPKRRWSRPYAVTLSNTVADQNLIRDGRPYRYLQNVGTSGLVMIAWHPDDSLVDIWLNQGAEIEGGYWRHAKILGTTAGVDLRGFVGIEGVE